MSIRGFRRLVRPAADDGIVICRKARMDMHLCCQADVYCVLQQTITFLFVLSVQLNFILKQCLTFSQLLVAGPERITFGDMNILETG